ncbi:MFS transporter [Pseudoalteromonas rubra]|uniref:MFS transporter n=1 Tax=Pseudoalteromonas rubra TaxID=43658 RepID=A0A5S3WL02_9GAMM|nr:MULTISPECIES: MFS transporter [Pseudoalteromonas]AZZ97454.1 MFS transporter [Pseudoalteromonas sp. R3]TMP28288.1 MFS transporter [Pseudoalteromonas rubra]TMP28326.1 MFS transporter [Pseudoalteromonas rubra]
MFETIKNSSSGMKTYYLMWLGQMVSVLGSGITSFAVGIWLLGETDSVTSFTMVAVITGLPAIIFSPIIGALVDRYDRKLILIFADTLSALVTLGLAACFYFDMLNMWIIFIGVGISAIATAFQGPANIAAITTLIERKDYGRVSGLMQMIGSISLIAGPLLAGALLAFVDLFTIFIIDLVTFVFALCTLLLVKIPKPEPYEGAEEESNMWQEIKVAWNYLFQQKDLVYLLLFFCLVNFVVSMGTISIVPMVNFTAENWQTGLVLSVGGIGSLVGASYLAWSGGPQRKINGILFGGLAMGICLFIMGMSNMIWVVMIGLFLFQFCVPTINGSSQVIWQTRIPPKMQGRVFALRRMFAQFTIPLGDFLAGPLADYVFEPVMRSENAVSNFFGPIIGTGPGRGIGLMLILLAALPVLFAVLGFMNKHIRNIDEANDDDDASPDQEADDTKAQTA